MEWGEEVKLLELKGRDRDRLIARKKDILWGEMIPYYSTDRNDAWELWDELPNPKFYSCSSDGKLHQVGYGNGKKSYVTTDGVSYDDVVSKAWLRWYYNTQWLKE